MAPQASCRRQLFLLMCLAMSVSIGGAKPRAWHSKDDITIVMVMMARDEEVNLRTNLPCWRDFIDYFVFGIDSKTKDESVRAIQDALPPSKPRSVFHFDFDGFGHARTLLLKEAWEKFPQATHLLIGDPDWIPELSTIRKEDLDHTYDFFQFVIWDRNNYTTRQSDWLMRHREGIYMKHRLHEVLVYPQPETTTKEIPWQVYEVETPTSWHVTSGHGHSQSYGRYVFDLELLAKDLRDEGSSPSDHTLYYLGTTSFALVEAGLAAMGEKEDPVFMQEANRRVKEGLQYLQQRLDLHMDSPNWEQTWAAMRWLAYAYQILLGDFHRAEYWYKRCADFDRERVDCPIFLARLYLSFNHTEEAWRQCVRALTTGYPVRAFGNNFYIYDCFTPIEVAKTVLARLKEHGFRRSWFALGWNLVNYATAKCDRGVLLEKQNILEVLRGEYQASAKAAGLAPEEAAACLEPDGEGEEQRLLRERLGVHVKICAQQAPEPEASQSHSNAGLASRTYPHAGYRIGPGADWERSASPRRRGPVDADSGLLQLHDSIENHAIGHQVANGTMPATLHGAPASECSSESPAHVVLSPDVVSHFLFRGSRDWRRPLRALVVGHDDPHDLRSLLDQLIEAGCPHEVVYAHDNEGALAVMADSFKGVDDGLRFRPLTTVLEPSDWGTFDYIAVSHVVNTSPRDPVELLRGLRRLLKSDGGMSITAFAKSPFLDAVDHLRSSVMAKLHKGTGEAHRLVEMFAEKAKADAEGTSRAGVSIDTGIFRAAPQILRSFRMSDLGDIVKVSGMVTVSVLGSVFYEPSNYVGDSLAAALDDLPEHHRLSVGEYFIPRSRHVIFAANAAAVSKGTVGELLLTPSTMPDTAPVAVEGRLLQDLYDRLRSNNDTVVRHQIPFSTETYEWTVSPLWAQMIRSIDGRRSVLGIFDEVAKRSGIQLQPFLEEFQVLMTIMTGLNLVVLRRSSPQAEESRHKQTRSNASPSQLAGSPDVMHVDSR